MGVLVTSAHSAKSLVVTRSLGRNGIDVTTSDYTKLAPTYYSKYSKDHFVYPHPIENSESFINCILKNVKKNNYEALIPVNSEETYLIAKYKHKFTPYLKVPLHDYDSIMRANDKGELLKIAEDIDIPIPKTYNLNNMSEIKQVAEKLNYPAVIKLKNTKSSIGLSYVHSKEEFISKYVETVSNFHLSASNLPIVQEYIPGDGYGVSALFNCGDPRAIFTHKRLREYPSSGGPSTCRISTEHKEMEKIAVKILKYLNWHGVAMVEFKLDSRTNKPYVIEINPRFWGSVNQAVAAGVDFPYLLYQMAVDGDVKPVFNYKMGVKTRFLINDFRSLSDILKNEPNKIPTLMSFSHFFGKNLYYDTLSFDDPIPGMLFYPFEIKKLWHRLK
ncbi:ATP-grasp domain-containing protein [Methanolobus sp. ZRKC3]|uniref:carboxylate--amine ligase n=1 Tax=Methanolobus sp. ZRKC3 TaxID=3125786 RepID=UPI003245AC36